MVTSPDAIEIHTYPPVILSIHVMCMAFLLLLFSMPALVNHQLERGHFEVGKKKSAEHTGSIVLFTACMMF